MVLRLIRVTKFLSYSSKMANALLEANKVLSGPRLEGTAPVSRTTLLSMILRNASTDELIRNLAASGHAYGSAVASLVTVVGDDDNMVEGSYFQLLGNLWRGRYRCTDVWPAASEKGAATVSIKIAGEQLIFPGNRSPRNYSAWINGLDSGYVQLHDKDGRPVDTTRWPENIGCSIRCILLPVAEDSALAYLNFVPVPLPILRSACAKQNVDLESEVKFWKFFHLSIPSFIHLPRSLKYHFPALNFQLA